MPIELIGSYHFASGARLGAGLVHHTGIGLDGDGYFEDVEFDDATGFQIEAGWKWVVVHYTAIDSDVSGFDDQVDAGSFGVSFVGEFQTPGAAPVLYGASDSGCRPRACAPASPATSPATIAIEAIASRTPSARPAMPAAIASLNTRLDA